VQWVYFIKKQFVKICKLCKLTRFLCLDPAKRFVHIPLVDFKVAHQPPQKEMVGRVSAAKGRDRKTHTHPHNSFLEIVRDKNSFSNCAGIGCPVPVCATLKTYQQVGQ